MPDKTTCGTGTCNCSDLKVVPIIEQTLKPINIEVPEFVKVAALVGFTSFLTYCANEMNKMVANKTKLG